MDYGYDQVGNRTQTTYPSGETFDYGHTSINQVASIDLNASALVDYTYHGQRLDARQVATDDPGGNALYTYKVGYDDQRRIDAVTNGFSDTGGDLTIAEYRYDYDDDGNVLGQDVVAGTAGFETTDRAFTVDTLNRLTDTMYFETGETESTVLDLVGNRERHTDRAGATHVYELDNPANEYTTIDGASLTYDAAGNLTSDEDGRQYTYDENNRLVEVRDSGNMLLASYEYDALGRRVIGDVGGSVTRYYYDGQSIIEERDGSDVRTRFHVNGAQFIDERVATYNDASGEFTYDLIDRNFSVVGTGDASGATIERQEYTPAGDFTYPGGGYFFDDDADGDIDVDDYPGFADCMGGPGVAVSDACKVHDYQGDGDVDLAEFAVYQRTVTANGVTPPYYANRATTYYHDFDFDRDVDQDDIDTFFTCFNAPVPGAACLAVHDFDPSGNSDGRVTGADAAGLSVCLTSETVAPPAQCLRPQAGGSTPTTGSFTLHGRPIDVLSDGKILTYIRARFYDAKHGRWLQRDRSGYADGGNLYESFGSNAQRFTDPMGTERGDWWDPRSYWSTFWDAQSDTLSEPLGNALYVVHVDQGTDSTFWNDTVILIQELPARQIVAREAAIAALEGREVNADFGHTVTIWARQTAGIDAMTDALVGFDLVAGESITGVDRTAQFFGGLSAYSFSASIGVGAGQVATQAGRSVLVARAAYSSGRPLGYSLQLGMRFSEPYPVPSGLRTLALNRVVVVTELESTTPVAAPMRIPLEPLTGEQLLFQFAEPAPPATLTLLASPSAPRFYSVAFETELARAQFGLRQEQHFQIANMALRAERISNPALAELVPAPTRWGRPPAGWTWQHATIHQGGGRAGILQLVPRSQHTPGSPFWPLFHPLPGGAGGYWEWAIPAGARPR